MVFGIFSALCLVALCWALARENSRLSQVRDGRPKRTIHTGFGDSLRVVVALGYAALFLWQFAVGKATGREAELVIYTLVALLPTVIAGFPWWFLLTEFVNWCCDPSTTDLTVLSADTLRHHAVVLLSFGINMALIFWFLSWSERQAARSASPGGRMPRFASREDYEAWKAGGRSTGPPDGA